jgi:serine/threonine-protein kinase
MIGQKLGTYEVLAKLGEGGMGEVYRARDTELGRDVALKILPAALANDPERLARFKREAQLLASLNHPNIAQIYDAKADLAAVPFLAMELVAGPTLAEVIERDGVLPPDEVIRIAGQLAEALEAAHESGIIHRDLKPANIKRREDGVVKVLDFGLGRALDASGGASAAASSATMLSPAATQGGVILGTAGYMSPEQAKGRSVDKRADIWAYGVVLFELLTGKRLFGGDTVTEVIASVIKDAPSLEALPAGTPPALRQLLARCLHRDPKMRLRDIGEARILLASADAAAVSASSAQLARPAAPSGFRTFFLAGGALVLAAVTAAVAWYAKPAATTTPVRRFDFPELANAADFAVSPDGRRVAYVLKGHLYARALDARDPIDLGAVHPTTSGLTWSPDGQRVAFGGESKLRIVSAEGGAIFTAGSLPSTRVMDGLWLSDNTILVALWRDSIYRILATGGTASVHVPVDVKTEIDFHQLTALPDGRLIVSTHLRGDVPTRLDLVSAKGRTPLSGEAVNSLRYRAPNHLLFSRPLVNPGVWGVEFDGGTLDLARAVLLEAGATVFDVSHEGTMLSKVPARAMRQLVWVSLSQSTSGLTTSRSESVETPRGVAFEATAPVFALSGDGRRVALVNRRADGQEELIVRELESGVDTRAVLPPSLGETGHIAWTPAGRLLHVAGGVEAVKIYDRPADRPGAGRALVEGIFARMTSDGHELLFNRDERGRTPLYRAAMLPDGTVGEPQPVFTGADESASIRYFDVSPDGKLLAFTITDAQTGQSNVHVVSYPDLRQRRQVTTDGGTAPRFSPTGRELYFLAGFRRPGAGVTSGQLRVASVTPAPLSVGVPKTLLTEDADASAGSLRIGAFDISRDGRLLMTRVAPSASGTEPRMVLLQNWPALVGK